MPPASASAFASKEFKDINFIGLYGLEKLSVIWSISRFWLVGGIYLFSLCPLINFLFSC